MYWERRAYSTIGVSECDEADSSESNGVMSTVYHSQCSQHNQSINQAALPLTVHLAACEATCILSEYLDPAKDLLLSVALFTFHPLAVFWWYLDKKNKTGGKGSHLRNKQSKTLVRDKERETKNYDQLIVVVRNDFVIKLPN